jgi:hypothetical protein
MGTVSHNGGVQIPTDFLEAMAGLVIGWHEALKRIDSLEQQLAVADARCRELRTELDKRPV